MGNTCPSPGGKSRSNSFDGNEKDTGKGRESQSGARGLNRHGGFYGSSPFTSGNIYSGGESAFKIHQMDELLRKAQEHNLKVMREDIRTDLNAFILDNLLLCIQLFDNFDKVALKAKEFKHMVEKQLSVKLTPFVNEGTIHGERRCVLLHGMGHQLAQNYIYKDNVGKRILNDDEDSENDDTYSAGASEIGEHIDEDKRTFLCDGILPLEFIVTWDNLEVYKENEWEGLKEYEYSAAKGMAPIARFCLEEPNEHNKVPKGYVRLRCVDIPMSIRLDHDPVTGIPNPPTPDEVYYSRASEFTEKVSEVGTSDSDPQSEDDVSETGHFRNHINKWTSNTPYPKRFGGAKQLQTPGKTNGFGSPPPAPRRTPLRGATPPVWGHGMSKKYSSRSEPNLAEVVVSLDSPQSAEQPALPAVRRNNIRQPITVPSVRKRLSKSMPKLTSKGAPKTGQIGDVYGILSKASSVASEDVREKWRQVQIKRLTQFPDLSREYKVAEPIHQSCYMPFKVEKDSDDEVDESSSTEYSDESSDTSGGGLNHKRKVTMAKSKKKRQDSDSDDDSKFDLRHYLNSSAFSSEFCSEFKRVGQQVGVAKSALTEAIVLGTTVRCSIPYPNGLNAENKRDDKNFYKVLYTFTPSLLSKSWPQRPATQIAWGRKIRDKKGPEILRWPQLHQVETMEMSGCNVIPLGLRSLHSTQSDHVVQPFNWQVGFPNPENSLLNTFKSVHWRCYIISALLFRAFIAPLGPLGIGLEHIRNILYEMCNIDFHNWPEEKPGVQLNYLLRKLLDSLSQTQMYNFFVDDYNMLKNIPSQNTKKVQASLKPVVDNIIIHCIYAFRNLKPLNKDFYPFPDFQQLYRILTAKERVDLIALTMDYFGSSRKKEVDRKKSRKKNKNKKSKPGHGMADFMLRDGEEVDREDVFLHKELIQQKDKVQEKSREIHQRIVDRERRKLKKEKREARAKERKNAMPQERKSSIDLSRTPEKKVSTANLRLPLLFKFFIKHFIKMARKSFEFFAYSQAAMYILHVENLCQILAEQMNEDAGGFREEIKSLRDAMGAENMREYVKSKYPQLEETPQPLDEVSMLRLTNSNHTNNWVLTETRELPPLPGTSRPSSVRIPGSNQRIARSLQSIPIPAPVSEDTNNNIEEDFEFESLDLNVKPIPRPHMNKVPRRTKFVQKPHFSQRPDFLQGILFSGEKSHLVGNKPPTIYL